MMQRRHRKALVIEINECLQLLNEIEAQKKQGFWDTINEQTDRYDTAINVMSALSVALDLSEVAQRIKTGKANNRLLLPFCLAMKAYSMGYAYVETARNYKPDALTGPQTRQLDGIIFRLKLDKNIPLPELKIALEKAKKTTEKMLTFLKGKYDHNATPLFTFFQNGGNDVTKNKIFPYLVNAIENETSEEKSYLNLMTKYFHSS